MNRRKFISSLIAAPVVAGALPPTLGTVKVHAAPQPTTPRKPFVLYWGQSGGGKTFRALNELVEHCMENNGALAVVMTPGDGETWKALTENIIPLWGKDRRIETSRGIETSVGRFHTHRHYLWMPNRHGGWSMIVEAAVCGKLGYDGMKGLEPSFIFAPNIDLYPTDKEWMCAAAQLHRRKSVDLLRHQFIAEANPAHVGCESWIYKRWFVEKPAMHRDVFFPA